MDSEKEKKKDMAEEPEEPAENKGSPEPEAAAEAAPEAAAEAGDPAVELAARIEECESLKDQLLRARAEFDNYRKRTAREMERVRRTASENLLQELLPVIDNVERALGHAGESGDGFAQGIKLVYSQFADVLKANGVEAIPALGMPFDPTVHEALSQLPSEEYAPDHIMEEFQRGYRIGDHVLRPAKVVVSSGPPASTGSAAPEEQETAADGEA
jgi:molecular chaperone GrpE